MKKFLETISNSKISFLFFALSAILGGATAMASAGLADVGANGSNTDPNLNTPLADATPDSPRKGIDQQGHAATGSALEQAELTESHLDDYVSKYRAYRFPLHTDILRKARQIKVDVKDPTNWEIGEAVMELNTAAAIGGGTATSGGTDGPSAASGKTYQSGDEEVTLTKGVHIFNNDWKLLRSKALVMVGAPLGYQGTVPDSSPLILRVVSKSNTSIVVAAVNGPQLNSNSPKYVPLIPANTTLFPMAPAMTESEIEVEPNNALPIETVCFLQKKVCAITYTELFERIKKKAKWNVQDMKDNILEMFRRECTRTMLISAPSRFTEDNPRTGTEYGYTENGILRQLRLGYELNDGQIEFEDMIGIQAMMCGKYDTPNELTAYCGTKFIQRLLNIDFTKHNEYTVRNYTDESTKIKITSFESNFGKLNFVHEYGLDDLGYSECAIIFSVEEAKHFYYQKGKTININHEKGEGGEVREAKTQYYVKDDCVKLDGFNSMIVGPSTLVGGYKLSALESVIKSVAKLSEAVNPSLGDIIYLCEDDITSESGKKFTIGLYQCTNASGSTASAKWSPYNGKSIYVG